MGSVVLLRYGKDSHNQHCLEHRADINRFQLVATVTWESSFWTQQLATGQ